LIIGVFLLTACGALDKAQVTAVESIASAIPANSWDELLQNFTEDLLCAAPGAVLLVDAPDGRFLKSIGVSSVEDQTPLQVSDAFEIGSNTKSFTVVLALQLQENGVWSLDDPLSNWLPDVWPATRPASGITPIPCWVQALLMKVCVKKRIRQKKLWPTP
jgi:D-alanyl-D-alanine carboxypeptidase